MMIDGPPFGGIAPNACCLPREHAWGYPRFMPVILTIDVEREVDGRWLAEVPELPGVLAYGDTEALAVASAEVLALRVFAERLEHGEAGALVSLVFTRAAA